MLPPYVEFWEELKRRGGIAKDRELYEIMRSRFNMSKKDYDRMLMILELRGYIHVEVLRKDERVVRALK